jgi:protein TonB
MEGGRIEAAFAFGLSLLVHLALLRQFAGMSLVPAMAPQRPIRVVVAERAVPLPVGFTTKPPGEPSSRPVQLAARMSPPAQRASAAEKTRPRVAARPRKAVQELAPIRAGPPADAGANAGAGLAPGAAAADPATGRANVGSGGPAGAGGAGKSHAALARYVFNPKPPYPRLARRARAQGLVVLQVVVSVDGRVKEVGILRSSGFRILDESARTTVRRWRFRPAHRHGERVESSVEIPIRFVLESK